MTNEITLSVGNYELTVHTHWKNYGDADPAEWGGIFVRFDEENGRWRVVEIVPAVEVGYDFDDRREAYHVEQHTFYPDDVWVDGEPQQGFTDEMEGVVNSLTGRNPDPLSPEFREHATYYVAMLPSEETDSGGDLVKHKDSFQAVLDTYDVDMDYSEH